MNIIQATGLKKKFPGVQALDGVDLSIEKGEIHAIVGENGAGKSTLIKILCGVYQADEGSISLDDINIDIKNPLEARAHGITVIFQELSLVPYMTVAENIFLGRLPNVRGVLDKNSLHIMTNEILEKLHCTFQGNDLVGSLSTGKRQMVEIARALAYKSKVIIFDEPTASLSSNEIEILFDNINKLKNDGASIIYITHKLEEVFKISDRITVMRDGKKIATVPTRECDEHQIVEYMIGRNIDNYYLKLAKVIGDEMLRVENFNSPGVFQDVNFVVKKGEILGFYGLVGAGRSELMKGIFGIDEKRTGELYMEGKKILIHHPVDAVEAGMAFVPEDRKDEGLILPMSVDGNMNIVNVRYNSKGPFLNKAKQENTYNEYRNKFSIKASSKLTPANNLSGGNQQKVVLAKWLSIHPKLLILDEPTRGIDVGSKSEIHRIIAELAKTGISIIVISSEMPEIIGLSDRIITMHNGKITGEFTESDINERNLMYAITNYPQAKDES